ncbi:MAG: hypothetical protein HYV90_05935 [Candidatus Woesebacteria bacterium]|nr:MAG: hypothetical protein HYV90_05935 [Candidatus Woesebacteria bacterium]
MNSSILNRLLILTVLFLAAILIVLFAGGQTTRQEVVSESAYVEYDVVIVNGNSTEAAVTQNSDRVASPQITVSCVYSSVNPYQQIALVIITNLPPELRNYYLVVESSHGFVTFLAYIKDTADNFVLKGGMTDAITGIPEDFSEGVYTLRALMSPDSTVGFETRFKVPDCNE